MQENQEKTPEKYSRCLCDNVDPCAEGSPYQLESDQLVAPPALRHLN